MGSGRTEDGAVEFEYWHRNEGDDDEGWFSWIAFWRTDAPNYSGVYRIVTQPEGEQTRVYVQSTDGNQADPEASEHLLVLIRERLG